jgi:diaminopimelate decarboxylase
MGDIPRQSPLMSAARLVELRDPRTGGRDVRELLERFGSPLFILDAARIDRQAARVASVFRPPRYRLYYAIKANPRVPVVRRLATHGFGCDATGIGDVEVARAAGCEPAAISVTGVGLSAAELRTLTAHGVHLNLDSIDELRLFCRAEHAGAVGLRVNPGIAAGFHPHVAAGVRRGKLGIDPDDLPEALAIARQAGVAIRTLHVHLGSLIPEPTPYLAACDLLLGLAARIPSVTTLNFGGGFSIPYDASTPEFPLVLLEVGLRRAVDDFEGTTGRRLTLAFEPGEFLLGPAGFLAATVRVTKPSARVAILDASANLLPAVLLYGVTYDAAVLPTGSRDGAETPWTLYGRTNQGGDMLAAGLTRPLRRGDIVLFSQVGAYAACRSSQFNQIPRPAEVMIDHGHVALTHAPEDHARVLRLAERTAYGTDQPRAELVEIGTITQRAGRLCCGYRVNGEAHAMALAFPESVTTLGERERAVLAGALGVLVAQLVLAERLAFADPLPTGLIRSLWPCLELLYNIRCYCDGRPLTAVPPMPAATDAGSTPLSAPAPNAHRAGTLVALSGGFDSSLLLRWLSRSDQRVEAVHFRVNEAVRQQEAEAAAAIAAACGIPLHVIDVDLPGLTDLGRRYADSFGRFPTHNTVPHGRDLLLIPLAAMLARRLGFARVAFGFERESRLEQASYQGATIHRHDFASEHGFDLVTALVRDHLDADLAIEAPLWTLSGARIRRTVLTREPALAGALQTCFWDRWCERCAKCVTTSMLQAELGLDIYRFRSDPLDDPQNEFLAALFATGRDPTRMPYWELAIQSLDRLAQAGDQRHWVRRFQSVFAPKRVTIIESARSWCQAIEQPALVARFGSGVTDWFAP